MNYDLFHLACVGVAIGFFLWSRRKRSNSERDFVIALSLLAVSSFGAGIVDTFPPVNWAGVWLNLFGYSVDVFFIFLALAPLRVWD